MPTSQMWRVIGGPPPALPRRLDQVADRWAAAPPRVRIAASVLVALMLLAIAGIGATTTPWGPPLPTVVARTDIAGGHTLSPNDLSIASWPQRLRGADAYSKTEDVVGRMTTTLVPAGTPIAEAHVTTDGLADSLLDDQAAFPLTIPDGTTLDAGDVIDVLGTAQGQGQRLASEARVASIDGAVAWLVIKRQEAPGLAEAAAWGQLTIALLARPTEARQ